MSATELWRLGRMDSGEGRRRVEERGWEHLNRALMKLMTAVSERERRHLKTWSKRSEIRRGFLG
jgi:hypothetical protein